MPTETMFGPVDYASKTVPIAYHCHVCKLHGCKLWREYSTFANHTELTCVLCTHKREGKPLLMDVFDQIGWRVAAVPTEAGDSFWGYTSVPDAGCKWWHALPDWVPT